MSNIQLTNGVKLDGKSIQAIDLLWTNASHISNFTAHTETISGAEDCDYFLIETKNVVGGSGTCVCFVARNSLSNAYRNIFAFLSTGIAYRSITSINGNQFTFTEARNVVDNSTSTGTAIPYRIYGIKTATQDLTS